MINGKEEKRKNYASEILMLCSDNFVLCNSSSQNVSRKVIVVGFQIRSTLSLSVHFTFLKIFYMPLHDPFPFFSINSKIPDLTWSSPFELSI